MSRITDEELQAIEAAAGEYMHREGRLRAGLAANNDKRIWSSHAEYSKLTRPDIVAEIIRELRELRHAKEDFEKRLLRRSKTF